MPRLPHPRSGIGLGTCPGLVALLWASAGLVVLVSGCSVTRGTRLRPVEGAKATATVGEQVLPPIVGTPGNQIVTAEPAPEMARNSRAMISGRVVDEQGRAVSGATVRLADGSSRAGKEIEAVTDGSGGFTLEGLRPGSGVYLVAEANFADARGLMVGRTRADTSARRVKIQLGRNTDSRDLEPADGAVVTPAPRGVSIADRREANDDVDDRDGTDSSSDRGAGQRPAGRVARPASTPDDEVEQASGWRSRGSGEAAPRSRVESTPPPLDDANDPSDRLDLDPGPSRRSTRPANSTRTGEANPLPMSVMPPSTDRSNEFPGPAEPEPPRAERNLPLSRTEGPQAESAPPSPPADDWATAGSTPMVIPRASPDANEPPPLPEIAQAIPLDSSPTAAPGSNLAMVSGGAAPPASAASADNFAANSTGTLFGGPTPIAASPALVTPPPSGPDPGDPATYDPFTLMGIPPRKPGEAIPPTIDPRPTVASLPASAPVLPSASLAAAASAEVASPAKSMTWAELAAMPTAEALVSPTPKNPTAPSVTRSVPVSNRTGFLLPRRSRGTNTTAIAPSCNFDAKTNRLIDFQLPAGDGSPVRFRDLGADLVLLDFWGTWCQPCMESVPHLIELQKQYGPNRLRIVGVACEDTDVKRRAAVVNKVAQTLGINYSVLITSHGGTCPLQSALDIQYYPTMVLVDRTGRIVWRGVGSTKANIDKLDQMIADRLDRGITQNSAPTSRLARR